MRRHLFALGLALGLGIVASQASATIISGTYDLTASGFTSTGLPAVAPVDPGHINFTLTFDNASSNLSDRATGLTVNSLNLPLINVGSVFTYLDTVDTIVVGGALAGARTVSNIQDDYAISIAHVSSSPIFDSALYFKGSLLEFFSTTTGSVTFTPAANVTPIPEPTSLVLLGTVLAGLGLVRRRRASL